MGVARGGTFPVRTVWVRLALLLFSLALAASHTLNLLPRSTAQSRIQRGGSSKCQGSCDKPSNRVGSATQPMQQARIFFPALLIGTYRLEVTVSSFQTAAITNSNRCGQFSNPKRAVEGWRAATETIEIADAATSKPPRTAWARSSMKTVQEIPLNGRHFTVLRLLTPGTMTPPANGFLSAPLRGQGSFGINPAGQREDTTNWLVNGVNLNDNVQNQITFQPPIDTLAQSKIDNSAFPAEYGRHSGAIVNLATRSGSNEYHGEAFEFFRNNALDARNFFNTVPNPQASFKRNEFGAAFGGPIKKNKAFFFLAYEGLRQHQSLTVTSTVPSQNQRATVTSPAVNSLLGLIPAANFHQASDASAAAADFTGFTGGAVANVALNQGSADLDFELTQKDRIHGYYVVQKDLRQVDCRRCNRSQHSDSATRAPDSVS